MRTNLSGNSRGISAAGLSLVLFLGSPAGAHLGIDEQVADLTRRLETEPGNALLYLRRGDLHRIHGEPRAAAADLLEARRLDPRLVVADLCLARVFIDWGWREPAVVLLDRVLAREPRRVEALVTRARVLWSLGRPGAAVEDYTGAIEAEERPRVPRPEHYLERARALAELGEGRLSEAIEGLEGGMERLGRPVTLELCAIELELQRRNHEGALRRLERITGRVSRKESWLARRGEILEQAGRREEAAAAFREVLAAIEALPVHHRNTRLVADLGTQARGALERLSGKTLAQRVAQGDVR